jgi:hypothetical protein
MNAWGPSGCREHLDEIVGWLEEEAGKRGWWNQAIIVGKVAKEKAKECFANGIWETIISTPLTRRGFLRQMVLGAIEKAESTVAQSSGS